MSSCRNLPVSAHSRPARTAPQSGTARCSPQAPEQGLSTEPARGAFAARVRTRGLRRPCESTPNRLCVPGATPLGRGVWFSVRWCVSFREAFLHASASLFSSSSFRFLSHTRLWVQGYICRFFFFLGDLDPFLKYRHSLIFENSGALSCEIVWARAFSSGADLDFLGNHSVDGFHL